MTSERTETEGARIEAIIELCMKLAAGDFKARGPVSEGGDQLDAIVTAINMLGEELELSAKGLKEAQDASINIMEDLSREIAERKRAEAELFKSENRFRALVEGTSDWVWEVNGNGVFTYSSPQVREILGYGAEEVLGKTPFDFMRPEEAGRVAEFFRATAATQKSFNSFENLNLHKDGHEVPVETNGVPYFGADGRFIGYRGINRDITVRKKAEEQLKRVYGELQEKSKYLERLNRQMVGRETRVLEMKKEVNDLLERLGEAKRYEWTSEQIK